MNKQLDRWRLEYFDVDGSEAEYSEEAHMLPIDQVRLVLDE